MNVVDIPVIGILLQLIGYLVTVCTQNGTIILALTAPLAFGALCGVMCERSGVVNIGIEGMMLSAAFVGWFVASIVNQAMPADPSAFFGATPGLVIGLLAAVLCGMLVSLLLAWLCISLRADQIIAAPT